MKSLMLLVIFAGPIGQLFAYPAGDPAAAVANKTAPLNATSADPAKSNATDPLSTMLKDAKAPNATDPMASLANATKGFNPADIGKLGTAFVATIMSAVQSFVASVVKIFVPTAALPGMDMLSKMPNLMNPADIGKTMMDDMTKLFGAPATPNAPKDANATNSTAPAAPAPNPMNPIEMGKNMMDGMMKLLGGPDANKDPKAAASPTNATDPTAPASNTTAATPPSPLAAPKEAATAVEDMGKNMMSGVTNMFSG